MGGHLYVNNVSSTDLDLLLNCNVIIHNELHHSDKVNMQILTNALAAQFSGKVTRKGLPAHAYLIFKKIYEPDYPKLSSFLSSVSFEPTICEGKIIYCSGGVNKNISSWNTLQTTAARQALLEEAVNEPTGEGNGVSIEYYSIDNNNLCTTTGKNLLEKFLINNGDYLTECIEK